MDRTHLLQGLAAAFNELAADKEAEERFRANVTVVDLDEWATDHARDLIADAELASGVNHHTTRTHVRRRLLSSGVRRTLRRRARRTGVLPADPWSLR